MWLFRDSQLNSNGKLQVPTRHRKSRIRYGYVRILTNSLVARSAPSRPKTWKLCYFITLSSIFVSASRHQKRSKSDPISWIRVRTRPAWTRSRTCTRIRTRTRTGVRTQTKNSNSYAMLDTLSNSKQKTQEWHANWNSSLSATCVNLKSTSYSNSNSEAQFGSQTIELLRDVRRALELQA